MTKPEKLFTRKYNDLRFLLLNGSEYSILKASAILRHFLVDGNPLVDAINRKYRLEIVYKADCTFNYVFQDGARLLFTPTQIGEMTLEYSKNLKELNKADFLKLKILKTKSETFTVREIIKYIANKGGGVHFEISENKRKDSLSSVSEKILLKAVREISRIVLIALLEIKRQIIKLPEGLPLFAHFTTGGDKHIFAQGIKQFMETRNIKGEIRNGFGVLFEINVLPQPKPGNRVIHEMGGSADCFQFKTQLAADGALESIAKINSSNQLKVSYPNYHKHFIDRWVSLISIIEFDNHNATFSLFINNKMVDNSNSTYKTRYTRVQEQTIGSNLRGKQNAAFRIVELIIINDKIEEEKKTALFNYFEGNWKR